MYTNIYQEEAGQEWVNDREGERYGQFIGRRMENYESALGV